jgi:hypothetical protein
MPALLASVVLAAAAFAQTPPAPAPAQRPAPPPLYNPTADAKAQIDTAVKSAHEDGIRVLLNWGANDDAASQAFAAARRNRDLTTFFSDEYKVVSIDVGRADKNVELARQYGVQLSVDALPALTVLDDTGKVIAQTTGAAFRSDADPATHDPVKIAAFLTRYQAPPAPDAEPLLAAGIARARAEGKTLFVWFSAPW